MTVGATIAEPLETHELASGEAKTRADRGPAAASSGSTRATSAAIRTSSRAASGSASASPGRSPSSPSSSSATSPSRRSTCRSRRQVLNLLDRPADAARADVPVHRPRPVGGQAHQRPGRGDVPRQDRRDRAARRAVRGARAIRTRAPCCRRSRCPTRPPSASAAGHPQGRRAEPGQSAVRLPVPHPLLAVRAPRASPSMPDGRSGAPASSPGEHRAACHFADEALKTDVGVAHLGEQPIRRGTPAAALARSPRPAPCRGRRRASRPASPSRRHRRDGAERLSWRPRASRPTRATPRRQDAVERPSRPASGAASLAASRSAASRRPGCRGSGRRQVLAAEVDQRRDRRRRRSPASRAAARSGQRGWKRQPVGGLTGLGTSPFRMTRWRRSSGSGIGIADISACGVRVLLLAEQLAPVGELGDAAEVHHRDPVADVLDDAHVVGDEDVGQAELALELLEQVQDLRLDRDVERRDGLVADDEVGLEHERPGDPDPLPLAAARTRAGSAARGTAGGRPGPSSARPSRAAPLACRGRGCAGPRRCCRRSGSAGRGWRTGPGR